jgi:hypothetical protein
MTTEELQIRPVLWLAGAIIITRYAAADGCALEEQGCV